MGKLKDFLAAEGDKLLAEADAETATERQWAQSVDAFLATISDWIRTADTNGIIQLHRDVALGLDRVTPVPRLRIEVGVRRVHILASSREVAGLYNVPGVERPMKCSGLVEMRGDETLRFFLFRIDGRDCWHVRTEGMGVKPLTQELFEALLTDFLT